RGCALRACPWLPYGRAFGATYVHPELRRYACELRRSPSYARLRATHVSELHRSPSYTGLRARYVSEAAHVRLHKTTKTARRPPPALPAAAPNCPFFQD